MDEVLWLWASEQLQLDSECLMCCFKNKRLYSSDQTHSHEERVWTSTLTSWWTEHLCVLHWWSSGDCAGLQLYFNLVNWWIWVCVTSVKHRTAPIHWPANSENISSRPALGIDPITGSKVRCQTHDAASSMIHSAWNQLRNSFTWYIGTKIIAISCFWKFYNLRLKKKHAWMRK